MAKAQTLVDVTQRKLSKAALDMIEAAAGGLSEDETLALVGVARHDLTNADYERFTAAYAKGDAQAKQAAYRQVQDGCLDISPNPGAALALRYLEKVGAKFKGTSSSAAAYTVELARF